MEQLENNRVYLFPIDQFVAFYQGRIDNLIESIVVDGYSPVTFEEEMDKIIQLFEGVITLDQYWQWVEESWEYDYRNFPREKILTELMRWIRSHILQQIPDFKMFQHEFRMEGLLFHYDELYLYVLDVRRQVYVPPYLYYKSRSLIRQS